MGRGVQEARQRHPMGLVLICKRCDKRAKGLPKKIGKELRGRIRDRWGKRSADIVMTSCQDICPRGVVVSVASPQGVRTFIAQDCDAGCTEVMKVLSGH